MYYHMDRNIRTIYLAGGCFWGVEGYFQRVNGVMDTEVGYANGATSDTDYQHVGVTDHAETVRVDYDRTEVSLGELLLRYFRIIDPTSVNRQGNDCGRQYRTGIYYTDAADLAVIESVMACEATFWPNIAVEVEPLRNWVAAEDYHQDYLASNPRGYCHINLELAREPLYAKRLPREISPSATPELYENLTHLERAVMLNSSTERPWSSPLEEEYRRGIYVDRISGEPLFASCDKFDSGCGWPAFSKAILSDVVTESVDLGYGMERIEVRSRASDSHLGHVFQDGPLERGGLRYCINGAALRFIPYEAMDDEGYGDLKVLVE